MVTSPPSRGCDSMDTDPSIPYDHALSEKWAADFLGSPDATNDPEAWIFRALRELREMLGSYQAFTETIGENHEDIPRLAEMFHDDEGNPVYLLAVTTPKMSWKVRTQRMTFAMDAEKLNEQIDAWAEMLLGKSKDDVPRFIREFLEVKHSILKGTALKDGEWRANIDLLALWILEKVQAAAETNPQPTFDSQERLKDAVDELNAPKEKKGKKGEKET